MLWVIGSSLSALAIAAGYSLLNTAKKDSMGKWARWASVLVILAGILGLSCAIGHGISHLVCGPKCGPGIEMCGPGIGHCGPGKGGHFEMEIEKCGPGGHHKMKKACCKGEDHGAIGSLKCDVEKCKNMTMEECKSYCDSLGCSPEEMKHCQKFCKDFKDESECVPGCNHGCKTKAECMKNCGESCGSRHSE